MRKVENILLREKARVEEAVKADFNHFPLQIALHHTSSLPKNYLTSMKCRLAKRLMCALILLAYDEKHSLII